MAQTSTVSPFRELGHLVAVEDSRRLLVFSGITIAGAAFLLLYGVAHVGGESPRLGTFYLICAVLSGLNLAFLYLKRNFLVALTVLNALLAGICAVLLYRSITVGFEPYWLFPALAIGLLINRFRSAAIYAGVLISFTTFTMLSAGTLQSDAPFTHNAHVRLLLSLTGMSIIVLVAGYRAEAANRLLYQLHSEDIHRLAYFDSLTGLANRPTYLRWLQKLLDRATRESELLAVLYVDLDNFKQINDRHGHHQGDDVLVEFGNRLAGCVRPQDGTTRILAEEDVARLAGDEFVITLSHLQSPAGAEYVAKRILELFDDGFTVNGLTHPISASVGIALSDGQIESAETLLNQADAAMYFAKDAGKNKLCFFSPDIAKSVELRRQMELGIQSALESAEFKLEYMPIYDSRSLQIVAVEALIRSDNALLSNIGPDIFIPVAESSGLIKNLDSWVLDTALDEYRQMRSQAGFTGRLCVNISAVELQNPEFPELAESLLDKHGIAPWDVEMEITETALVAGDEHSVKTLLRLRELGLGISLDDFGTGYTAFNQLMRYPVDTLKIDRSFVRDIFSSDGRQRKMAGMLRKLAQLYELRVIAEGVETARQLKYLKRIGCDYVQGFYLCEPLAPLDLIDRLRENNN